MDYCVSCLSNLLRQKFGHLLTSFRIINGVAFAGTLLFYFPKNHHHDLIKSHIIKKIDFVGAVLSIVGLTIL